MKINKIIISNFKGIREPISISPALFTCIVGKNDVGKSTILKVITGNLRQDAGDVYVEGKKVKFRTVNDSKAAGITMVYQELSLIPELTVAENIYLGKMPMKAGMISYREAQKKAKEILRLQNNN